VPSKAKPLTDAQLRAYESKRELAVELLQSVKQMKAGKVVRSSLWAWSSKSALCECAASSFASRASFLATA